MSNITISDLEQHFVKRVDQGLSNDSIFKEFATMINAKFIKFNYRNPDSYGVLVDETTWINLFYSPQRNVFGFQALQINGDLQAVLSLQHSDSSIVDVILRLTANIGNFSFDDDNSEYDDDSFDSNDSYDSDDEY